MILPDCNAFPRTGRILGIDWGARRSGVAVSDPSREFIFTRPPIVMPRGGGDIASAIVRVAMEEGVVAIIMGLPVHADGTESETAASVRATAAQVASQSDVPILFIPENLTSVAAQEQMGRVRRSDIKQKLDSESARVILENAIAILKRLN